jgi:hypothetical protein
LKAHFAAGAQYRDEQAQQPQRPDRQAIDARRDA